MKQEFNEKYVVPVSMKVIAFGKKYVANTWIHRLPFTEWAYRKIFYLGREIGESTISFHGKLLTVNTKDISMVPALINNNFEEYELYLFQSLINTGDTVFDVGANIGVYSLLAAERTGKAGRVYSFEPIPENFELLGQNLTQNKITNVTIINKAVGDFDGEIKMEIEEGSLATHHVAQDPHNPVSVQVTTLDGYFHRKKLNRVDLIKMDIEGYEGFAIEGAKTILKNRATRLLMEFSADFIKRSGKDPKDVGESLLKEFKYCYFVNERAKKLSLIDTIDDLLDYKQTNFLFSHTKVNLP